MDYQFLIDTYETERSKVLSTWSTFKDEDLDTLIKEEAAGGNSKASLPGTGDKPCTERPE